MTLADTKQYFVKFFHGELNWVWFDIPVRLYKGFYEVVFWMISGSRKGPPPKQASKFSVKTDFPVAYESPDHLVPCGTKKDNSTNKKFVLFMNDFISRRFPGEDKFFLDLGCSGGQLVKDFMMMNWLGAGLEGSDYSLKHKRANWATLAGTNLFTADITKPYQIFQNGEPARFHLITAWEVMEHIPTPDLPALFGFISRHLREGGYLVASTTGESAIVNGMEFHQTRMNNTEWKNYLRRNVPELEEAELGLKFYQYVRFNYRESSFLIYRKAGPKN